MHLHKTSVDVYIIMEWANNMLIISCLNSRSSQNTIIKLYVLACRVKTCHGLFFYHPPIPTSVLNFAYFNMFCVADH